MTKTGLPFILSLNAKTPITGQHLARLSWDKTPVVSGESINERWLQTVLDEVPSLLPIEGIDERVETPLVSLGREIETPSGPIDNLFISHNGHLVVVETKLWRNPESRRKVVAQILDYATHLRTWDYAKIEELWNARQRTNLWEGIQPENFLQHEWIDRVNENLSKGRMSLLIVGDGIQTQAQQLADAISGNPNFLFRLGFVELQLFQLDDARILVLPVMPARTMEIERAVVRVEYVQQTPPQISVTVPPPEKTQQKILNEEALLAAVRSGDAQGSIREKVVQRLITLLQNTDVQIFWTNAGFSIKLLDPSGSGINLVLGGVNRPKIFYAIPSTLTEQLSRGGWRQDSIEETKQQK
jgi:hypothetical protein